MYSIIPLHELHPFAADDDDDEDGDKDDNGNDDALMVMYVSAKNIQKQFKRCRVPDISVFPYGFGGTYRNCCNSYTVHLI